MQESWAFCVPRYFSNKLASFEDTSPLVFLIFRSRFVSAVFSLLSLLALPPMNPSPKRLLQNPDISLQPRFLRRPTEILDFVESSVR